MKPGNQRSLFVVILIWVLLTCIGGIVVGVMAAPRFIKPTQIVITEISRHELVITQIVGGPTYTPYPTFTQPPATSTPTLGELVPGLGLPPTLPPTETLTPSPSGLQLVNYSWNVFPGQQAFIEIKTSPGGRCTINYIDTAGDPVELDSLTPLVADENGLCAWRWTIDENTQPGSGSVFVTAGGVAATYLLQVQSTTPNP
jgi:hypothetical protein